MLGIARDAANPDELWAFAKHLYLSPELSRRLFQEGDIISPVREFWKDPVYDAPDAFFRGQPRGRLYVSLADQVPPRYNSAFSTLAVARLQSVASQLAAIADSRGNATRESLLPDARHLLAQAQKDVMTHVRRNRFFSEDIEHRERQASP